jgi:hypothetical protein
MTMDPTTGKLFEEYKESLQTEFRKMSRMS